MAHMSSGLSLLIERVPEGKSLHLWSDGHCSFEDRFDGSSEGFIGTRRTLGMGTNGGAGDGGCVFSQLLRAIDRLEIEGNDNGRGFVANVGVASAVGGGKVDDSTARVRAVAGSSSDIQRDNAACMARADTCRQGETSSNHLTRGPNWQRNQEWKELHKAKRRRRLERQKSKASSDDSAFSGGSRSSSAGVEAESNVPEWRRQNVRAMHHKGAFADCSEEVQRELRETRARMLVEKNKTAVVEAEHNRRTLEARLKARMIENEVERKRMELEEANDKLLEAKLAKLPKGFAETVISMGIEAAFEDNCVTDESVSPSSSISVAELNRKNAAIVALTTRVAELELEQKKKVVKPSRKVEKVYGGNGFGSWTRSEEYFD